MKTYKVNALYTISVEMEIEASSYEEALDIAQDWGDQSIETEWNGNSVFADPATEEIIDMKLCADGMMYDFQCEDEE